MAATFCWVPGAVAPLQEASSLEQNVKGKAVSAESKRAQAVASIRREETVLAQQASELAGQVRNMDHTLYLHSSRVMLGECASVCLFAQHQVQHAFRCRTFLCMR